MREEFSFSGGLSNSQDETKTPREKAWAMQNATTLNGVLEGGPRYDLFGERTSASASDVGYGLGYGKFSNNETQKLKMTGTPTGGTVRLTWSGQQTATIVYNATAEAVRAALEGLSNINTGDIKTSGGPWPGQPIYVEFRGQYANADQSIISLSTNSLSGGSTPSITITEYLVGGETEVYLAAVKNSGDSTVTMYKVNASTGVYTVTATGLNASTWHFQQYGNRIFAVNSVDGIHYQRIGGSWDDTGGTARPNRPGGAPTGTTGTFGASYVFTGSTITASGVTETVTIPTNGSFLVRNTGGAAVVDTEININIALPSSQDFSHHDWWVVFMDVPSNVEADTTSLKTTFENAAAAVISPSSESIRAYDSAGCAMNVQFLGVDRTTRDDITDINLKFSVSLWPNAATIRFAIYQYHVWMNNGLPASSDEEDIVRDTNEYAISSYNATTDVESLLSDSLVTSAPVGDDWVTITGIRGNPQLTTSDRIYVYRREKKSRLWRRLPVNGATVANLTIYGAANITSGTTTFVDKWSEYELADFPTPTVPDFPGVSNIASGLVVSVWKRCLQLGAGKKWWHSFKDSPDLFAPDPDDDTAKKEFAKRNKDNIDAGRTVYMSDTRSEDIKAIIGQDTCYGVTDVSSYAMVGDQPVNASEPRRLPGSRGCVSQRGAYRFRGGIHVGAEDGLFYYAVGRGFSGEDNGALVDREETEPCRRSWITTLLGSSYSNLCVVEHLDEVWCFNGTKYLVNNRHRRWEEGTFTDTVVALVSVRARGLRFLSSTGKIYTISSLYSDDNGTTVNWSYETGILEGPASRVTGIEVEAVGTPYIIVKVYTPHGTDGQDDYGKFNERRFDLPTNGAVDITPVVLDSGYRHKFTFGGIVGRDKVTGFALEVEGTGKAFGGRK